MGKIETNKQQKQSSLLNTAFKLFTTKGVNKTSIAEISQQAGIAKGTFYLYFKDKYDIRNKLISHESSKLFKNAAKDLQSYAETVEGEMPFDDQIIFMVNHIISKLNSNKTLLTFISKNLSWGIFKEALTTNVAENDINFKDVFYQMIDNCSNNIKDPEIMIFLIIELVSSTCYSVILDSEPADLETIKPYLFSAIRAIIAQHIEKENKQETPPAIIN